MAKLRSWIGLLLGTALLLLPLQPLWALSILDLPSQAPQERVVDRADILSRATVGELQKRLEDLAAMGVSAHLVTVRNLDYGLSPDQLSSQLADRWQPDSDGRGALVLLIDGQNNNGSIAVSGALQQRLPAELLRSTASATMGIPLRDGGRYRQASLDALQRLATVLSGQEDPGTPDLPEVQVIPTNIPSREQTAGSHAMRWVIILLVIGSVVPMVTWWVFSR